MEAARRATSTVEGYLKTLLRGLRNDKTRTKHTFDIDLGFLMNLYNLQNGRCAISNIEMTWGLADREVKYDRKPHNISIDRFDRSKGYTKDNVVLMCNAVNMFKGCFDVSTVFEISKQILKNENRINEVMGLIHSKYAVQGE